MLGRENRESLVSQLTNGPYVDMEPGKGGDSKDVPTIRIGMVGNHKVGKTSLLRRFVKKEVQSPASAVSTFGYDDSLMMKVKINDENFNI